MIDHVAEVAEVSRRRSSVLCHVDACLGGWMLPFWERARARPSRRGTFRRRRRHVDQSADIHKYGYAFKGASILAYRDKALLDRQLFLYDEWPGGLYGSGTTAGTRPGAPIAGAWTAIRYLGRSGYLRMAEAVRDTTRKLQAGIATLDGLEVTGDPDMSVFQIAGPGVSIDGVGDVMDDRGWNLDRQQGGLHLMVSPYHAQVADRFLDDLAAAVADHGEGSGKDAVYGGVV